MTQPARTAAPQAMANAPRTGQRQFPGELAMQQCLSGNLAARGKNAQCDRQVATLGVFLTVNS